MLVWNQGPASYCQAPGEKKVLHVKLFHFPPVQPASVATQSTIPDWLGHNKGFVIGEERHAERATFFRKDTTGWL